MHQPAYASARCRWRLPHALPAARRAPAALGCLPRQALLHCVRGVRAHPNHCRCQDLTTRITHELSVSLLPRPPLLACSTCRLCMWWTQPPLWPAPQGPLWSTPRTSLSGSPRTPAATAAEPAERPQQLQGTAAPRSCPVVLCWPGVIFCWVGVWGSFRQLHPALHAVDCVRAHYTLRVSASVVRSSPVPSSLLGSTKWCITVSHTYTHYGPRPVVSCVPRSLYLLTFVLPQLGAMYVDPVWRQASTQQP